MVCFCSLVVEVGFIVVFLLVSLRAKRGNERPGYASVLYVEVGILVVS